MAVRSASMPTQWWIPMAPWLTAPDDAADGAGQRHRVTQPVQTLDHCTLVRDVFWV
jgi:hypothetical protein